VVIEILDPIYVKSKLDQLDISLTSLRDAIRGAGARTLTDLYDQLASIYGRLDIALSALRDALRGVDNRTLTDLYNIINSVYGRLDVALSSRASESTLSALSGKFPSATALSDTIANPTTTIIGVANLGWDGTYWRRLAADTSSRLKVNVEVTANPPNLDVALSTIRDRLPTSLTGAGNFKIAILEDTVGLLKDTKIPNPIGILTGVDVGGSSTNAVAVIDQNLPSRMPYLIENIAVSTTEGSTSIAAPGAKILKIKNKGDVEVLIGINGAVPATNPLKIKPRCLLLIPHKGITQVNYKTATGSSTIDIEYYN